jgi:hypothetical protein
MVNSNYLSIKSTLVSVNKKAFSIRNIVTIETFKIRVTIRLKPAFGKNCQLENSRTLFKQTIRTICTVCNKE